MKIRTKKILALTLAATMILTSAPINNSFADEVDNSTATTVEQTADDASSEVTTAVVDENGNIVMSEDTTQATSEDITTEAATSEDATSEDNSTENTTDDSTTEDKTSEESKDNKDNKSDEKSIVVFDHIYNDVDTSNIKTKDLFVQTSDKSVFTKNTNVVSNYENTYIISCVSVDEAKSVFSYYTDKVDFISDLQDTMSLSDNDSSDSKSSKDVADLSDVNKDSDDAIANMDDVSKDLEKDDYSGYIALIDSGVNTSEINDSDLKTVSVVDENPTTDSVGHGTSMYNYIKDEYKAAKVLSIKAFDSKTSNVADIYAAIKLAIESKVSVINLSFVGYNTEQNQPIKDIINEAINAGITVIGAAGNASASAKNFIPGCIDNALIIGAVNEDQTLYETSNFDADYYVIATSTSEAAARYSGIYSGSIDSNKVFVDFSKKPAEEDKNNDFKDNDITKGKITTDKTFAVKYLFVDKNCVNSNTTIDSIYEKNPDAVIYQRIDTPTLYKQDDVYMFYVNKPWTTNLASGQILDYCFANANDNGEVITDGVKLDTTNKIAYLNADKFDNKQFADGQLQVLVPIDTEAQNNINVNIFNKNNTLISSSKIKFDIFEVPGIQFDDNFDVTKESVLNVNENGSKCDFTIDEDENTIFLDKFAIEVDSIDITLNTTDSFLLATYTSCGSYSGISYKTAKSNGNIVATFQVENDSTVWKNFSQNKFSDSMNLYFTHNTNKYETDSTGGYINGITGTQTLWYITLKNSGILKGIGKDTKIRCGCSHAGKGGSYIDSGTLSVKLTTVRTVKDKDNHKLAIVKVQTNGYVNGSKGGAAQTALGYFQIWSDDTPSSYLQAQKLTSNTASVKCSDGHTIGISSAALPNVVFRVYKSATGDSTYGYAKSSKDDGTFSRIFSKDDVHNKTFADSNASALKVKSGTKVYLKEIGVPFYGYSAKGDARKQWTTSDSGWLAALEKENTHYVTTVNNVKTYNPETVTVTDSGYIYLAPSVKATCTAQITKDNKTTTCGKSKRYFVPLSVRYGCGNNARKEVTTKSSMTTSNYKKLHNGDVQQSYCIGMWKTDKYDDLSNAVFTVTAYNANNTVIETYPYALSTNENGIIALNNDDWSAIDTCVANKGYFIFHETQAPANHLPKDLTVNAVTSDVTTISIIGATGITYDNDVDLNDLIDAGYTQAQVENDDPFVPRYIKVKKVDEDGNPIPGVQFTVSYGYYGSEEECINNVIYTDKANSKSTTIVPNSDNAFGTTIVTNTPNNTVTTGSDGTALITIDNVKPGSAICITCTETYAPPNIWNYQDENGNYPNQYLKISSCLNTTENAANTTPEGADVLMTEPLKNYNHIYTKLVKESGNKTCTDGNPNYDLTGAEFKIFKSERDAQKAIMSGDYSAAINNADNMKLVTDKDGNTAKIDITNCMDGSGAVKNDTTFYVVESKLPKEGYGYNETRIQAIPVSASKMLNVFTITDPPITDPLNIKFTKYDSFGNVDTNFNGNVTFKYSFYPLSMTDKILSYDEIIASGVAPQEDYSNSMEITNDLTVKLTRDFPRGYLVIDEIEWPSDYNGYNKITITDSDGTDLVISDKDNIKNNHLVFVTDAVASNNNNDTDSRITYYPMDKNGNVITNYTDLKAKGIKFVDGEDKQPEINLTTYNKAIRGDVSLKKVDHNGDPIEGVKFSIKNVLTGETHYMYTDKDGVATTKVDGRYHESDEVFNYYDTHDEYNPDVKAEVWFGLNKDGKFEVPSEWQFSDTPCALWGAELKDGTDTNSGEYKIGDYVIKEERCDANNTGELKFQLEPSKAFHIGTDLEDYVVTDKNATENEGKIWNMPSPKITTKANVVETSDADDKDDRHQTLAQAGTDIDYKNQTINDVVSYTNLRAGTDYTYLTELMIVDKEGNVEPYMKDDEALRIVTPFTTKATYKHSIYEICGDLTIPIKGVDPTGLEEQQKKLVVYETLYLGTYKTLDELDKAIEDENIVKRYDGYTDSDDMDFFPLEHKDKNDDYQTVRPGDIHTTIANNVNLDRIAKADPIVKLTDRVYYTGLTVGKEYKVEGKLIVKDPEGTTKVTYDPKNPDADEEGFVTVVEDDDKNSSGDASEVVSGDSTDKTDESTKTDEDKTAGTTTLADGDTTKPTNTDEPSASADASGDSKDTEDTVKEEPVESRTAYVLKDSDGKDVTVSKTFVAKSTDGYIDLEFTVDASQLQNKSTVAFETLSYKGIKIALHADLNDEDETVHFPEIGTTTYNSQIKLGEDNLPILENSTEQPSTTETPATTETPNTDQTNKDQTTTSEPSSTDQPQDTSKPNDTQKSDDGKTSGDASTTTDDKSKDESKDTVKDDKASKFDKEDKASFKQVKASDGQSFYDRINYKNLLANRSYMVKGTLMDKATGEVMKDANDKEIKAEMTFKTNEVGEVVLDKTPNAVNYVLEDGTIMDLTADNADYLCNGYVDLLFDGYDFTNLANKIGVVFEEVYLLDNDKVTDTPATEKPSDTEAPTDTPAETPTETPKEDEEQPTGMANKLLVASHKDIDDVDQFIYYAEAKTNAKDLTTNEKIVPYDMETTIEDTVTYKNLIPGKEYKLKATLHVKNDLSGKYQDGDALLDQNGNAIEVEKTFTPEEKDGSVKIQIPVNTKDLHSMQIVVFENVFNKYCLEVAAHCDINDTDQTVEVPNALTTASITSYEDITNITLVDTISYNNFIPGKTYIAKGYLVDQETGERVQSNGNDITAETTFTPEKADDTVDVTFNFSGEELSGKYVVFEEVYIETIDTDTNINKEVLVAQHKDLNDDKQTVAINMFMNIQIAKADSDNIKYYLKGAEITLYTEDGKVAKDTDGKKCIAVTDEDGLVSFDVAYGKYYAMETKAPNGYYISKEKYEVTPTLEGREDVVTDVIKINILDDAIIIPPKTGENMIIILLALALAIGATGIVLFTRKRKKNNLSE